MAPEAEATLLMTGAVRRPMEIVQRNGPIGSFLALVAPAPEADHATVRSRDGLFSASIPLEWLVLGHLDRGRLRIPGAPTNCWSVKDVVSINFTVGAEEDSVRPESFTAPI
ncbi:MAG: hypothetical protein H6517_03320 [Microthrixaceae bacterium]|nr:hypothetical protein [Microthrixaceae bacterium]MCB1012474.1 hypothetical protein [Microthrixaceae bacterium]MCB9386838.1 hypothetical protein [Microthrixaceae bacterium]MCO5321220.1 hypothetical protein [Microthrixaceae bacterium]